MKKVRPLDSVLLRRHEPEADNDRVFGTTIQENINNSMWNYGAALSLIMSVSYTHLGKVSQEMFSGIWKGYFPEESHVGYVTNEMCIRDRVRLSWTRSVRCLV